MSKGQYVCQRAAHAIIAEIGQLRVSGDALGAINLFIDEFISLLITTSCSVDLVSLKSAVIQLLPHSLGKNALVEAEIELKQQVEQQQYDFTSYEKMRLLSRQEFQCNEIIPVLQMACADYCTLTSDDNNNNNNSYKHTIDIIHIPPVVVIYVTAIVEHVAEYLLNSVAMTADQADAEHIRVKEVLVTLLDDPQVNTVFKRMNLKEKLEKRVSTFPTMNINNNNNYYSLPTPSPSPISTRKQPSLSRHSTDQSTRDPDISFNEFLIDGDINDEPRVKVDSSISSIRSSESISDRPLSIMSNGTIKSSGSKSRFNFFSNNNNKKEKRTSISLNFTSSSSSKRQPVMTSPTASSFHSNTSSPVNTDFDDLIRSGKTKKVTLTPNRLKSIEIKKEHQRQEVTPWENLPTTTTKTIKTKKRSTMMMDTSPPPPLPPLPRLIHRDTSQQQQIIESTNSPPLTPASSVASRPSQRSRHSIIYEESMKSSPTNESLSLELQRASSKISLNSIHSKESHNNNRIIERPSSMVVKRASMGSRPPSFHENVLFMDNSNHMLMAAAAAGSVAVDFDHPKQDYEEKRKSTFNKSEDLVFTTTNEQNMIYVVPTSTTTIHHHNNNKNKLRSMDKGCQTEPIALHTLIHTSHIHKQQQQEEDDEAEEEWFIEEEDWEDQPSDEEKCVVEWLLGNA